MSERFTSAMEDFSFRFYQHVIKNKPDSNTIVSPLSVGTALSLASSGAGGETRNAMAHALGLSGMDQNGINLAYDSLYSALRTDDRKIQMVIANSIWADDEVVLKESFVKSASQCFGADIESTDMHNPDVIDKINRWVSDKTFGKISTIADEDSVGKLLVLVNSFYFKGIWHNVFRTDMTREQAFFFNDGTEKKVRMMFQEEKYNYFETKDFQAVSLPYGYGRISMYVFLPRSGMPLVQFNKLLTKDNWNSWLAQFRERQGRIGLPRFRQEWSMQLNEILKAMDMGIIFDAHADFGGMVSTPEKISIDSVNHKTFIEVNERGTEAAAVTDMEAKEEEPPGEEPFTMIVNRPFFFAIRDNKTGALLFMGSIFEPGNLHAD